MTTPLRRRLLVIPLAAVIGLGGVMLTGTAAFADEVTPAPSATSTSTPTPDPTSTPDPTPTPEPTPTSTPAPVPTSIDLLTPEADKPAFARTVVFAGTAPQGATITVTDADKTVLGTAVVGESNVFAISYTYPADASSKQSVTVTGSLDGTELKSVKRSFTLPKQDLPAPVITAPVAGSTVYGDRVTFSGTGTPGKNVIVVALPTAILDAAANARSSTAATPADPADPADAIVVAADGTWSVTLTADPGDYTATAVLVDIDADGKLVSLLSPPSAPVQFILAPTPVAPVVIVTPTPAPAAASKHELANTGLDATGIAAAAALFGIAGLTLLFARRQRA